MVTNVGLYWHFNQVLSEVMAMELAYSEGGGFALNLRVTE
jgi:hypothetical protein